MQLPPVLVALVRLLSRLLFSPVIVYVGLKLSSSLVEKHALQWLIIPAYLFSLPAAFAANVLYTQIKDHMEAARHGAILPLSMKYRWPGALDKLLKLRWNFYHGYLGEYWENECKANGNTFNFCALYENRIFTTEPEYVKAVLATQFSSFVKGPVFHEQFDSLLGTGVLNSDGEVWKFHRMMTRPFFSKNRISNFDIFEKHAEDAIQQMKIRLREGYPVDFQDVASRFTLDSATEFLFGKDIRTLSAGLVYPPSSPSSKDPMFLNHPANRLFRTFKESQIATVYRAHFGPSWRFMELWQDQVQKHMKVWYEAIDPIIADVLAKKHEQKRFVKDDTREVKEGETLLDHLVNYTEDQKLLRDEIVNIMLAGGETTAATLTFMVYMLSQHPDVLARLREEIITQLGVSRQPTSSDIRDMKYLRAFINEVLRLYPPIPFDCRTSIEGQIWPSLHGGKPLYIPPNTTVIYCCFLIHRRKDLWGPDADLFDPDRFLDERLDKFVTPNPYIFLPFNAGPRICLGQQFAYHEVSYFLIRLLQTIDCVSLDMDVQHLPPAEWAQADGRRALEKVVLRNHLSLYVKDGLWVRMKEADPVDAL